jgi:hypothetical protein
VYDVLSVCCQGVENICSISSHTFVANHIRSLY